MGDFSTANDLATLNAGRVPLWSDQEDYSLIPSGSVGVAVDLSTRMAVKVSLRTQAPQRRADLTIPTFDAAGTYVVTVNGTTHTSATPASRNAALVALAAAINAGAQAGVVTASTYDADGAVSTTAATTLRILGDTEDDFTLDFTASGGTTELAAVADPSEGTIDLWLCWAGTAASGSTAPALDWGLINGQTYQIDGRGWNERFEVAGAERVYVRVYDLAHTGDGTMVTYTAAVKLGPCQAE